MAVTPARAPACTGVILAGGQASRFGGRPKGLELIQGQRVIDRVAGALREAVRDAHQGTPSSTPPRTSAELLLVANDPAAAQWLAGVPVVADLRPGMGSLGGLLTALASVRGPVLVVAWDMPFVPAGLLRALRAEGESGLYDAVVPSSGSRRGVEPLCAYYTPACAAPITHRLDAGDRRMIGFLEDVRVHQLAPAVVRQFGDPGRLFLNINEPADLAAAEDLTDDTTG
jgi:molybdopterin-guanine dinucleotide biosynthesis protein A